MSLFRQLFLPDNWQVQRFFLRSRSKSRSSTNCSSSGFDCNYLLSPWFKSWSHSSSCFTLTLYNSTKYRSSSKSIGIGLYSPRKMFSIGGGSDNCNNSTSLMTSMSRQFNSNPHSNSDTLKSSAYTSTSSSSDSTERNSKTPEIKTETEKKLTFVSRPNPVTGKMDWILQDENYDFTQEIARSGYGDMLHDTDRNEKYYEGIRKTVALMKSKNIPVNVLDIGTGTGLLSMMAANVGADSVTACEAFPPMAECADKVMRVNNLKEKIRLIPKRSTEVLNGEDMPKRANLLVTELFDTELIGEGAIWSYTDALTRLMEENCFAVPSRARIYIQAVQSDFLRQSNDILPLTLPDGSSIIMPNSFSSCSGAPSLHDLQVDELEEELIFISDPIEVFRFDFCRKEGLKRDEYIELSAEALCSGQVDAFVMWWDLDMDLDGEILLSCAPKWTRPKNEVIPWRDHWMQAIYYPSSSLPVSKGVKFPVFCSHDEYSLWFDTAKTDRLRPICTCGLHVAFSRNRLGQLSENKRNKIFLDSLQKHIKESTVCLVISDGSLLPLLAAKLGAQQVFYLDTNTSSRRKVKQIVEVNNLEDRIKILDDDAENLTGADFNNMKIDLVIAEPFFQASSLPWEHLYFWYATSTLREFMTPDVVILPQAMKIKAMALRFRDLHKIRIPVGNCEGFDITEFDKLIQESSDAADPEIEPQPLWEYPSVSASAPQVIMSLDFTQQVSQMSVLKQNANIELFREMSINGIGYWTEFDFGDGVCLTTGISTEDNHVGEERCNDKVRWDKFSKQGAQLFRQEISSKESSKFEFEATFTPQTGDVAIKVQCDTEAS